MKARLFVVPASHPSRTAQMMLERKGIEYSRIDLVLVLSKPILRGLGFPRVTVPALRIDGAKVQGSRDIARELDRLVPEPPLFPADPEARAEVEEAEKWGDEVLQSAARRLT
jgi:glutathione S-transferase